MKEPKIYVFKKRSLVFDVFLIGFLVTPLPWLIIRAFPNLLPFLLVGTLPMIIIYFQIYVCRITRQFNKYDSGKTITINPERTTLTINRNNETLVLKKDEVERVEIYQQKYLGKFGRFEYIVVYSAGKSTLITDFTIPLLIYDRILESFLSKKPRTYFKKRINFIDESRFGQDGG